MPSLLWATPERQNKNTNELTRNTPHLMLIAVPRKPGEDGRVSVGAIEGKDDLFDVGFLTWGEDGQTLLEHGVVGLDLLAPAVSCSFVFVICANLLGGLQALGGISFVWS